jgi:hypothetical protein
MRSTMFSLACLAALSIAAAAPAAAGPAGSYKGKIDYQGYEITFKVTGSTISKVRARMLTDCDGSGYLVQYQIAPGRSWKIRNGKFSGTKVITVDQTKEHVVFQGTISGGKAKGFIREWDSVEGGGVVCDTLKRTFTATRR